MEIADRRAAMPGRPSAEDIAAAAAASPLREGPGFSELADAQELAFRQEIEEYAHPAADIPRFIERKELLAKLDYSLRQAGIVPAGTIVDLGAGSCWLGAALARRAEVERVVAVEFSRRRLADLAPVAIAHLGAPAAKIERVVADFYNHGLGAGFADLVFTDAAFHHGNPVRLASVARDLLRPDGRVVLFREPTLSLLRRSRDHGIEDDHGSFEREYDSADYLRHLRAAGFEASRHRAAGGFEGRRARALLRPPLSWLNGILFSEFTYVGIRHRQGVGDT